MKKPHKYSDVGLITIKQHDGLTFKEFAKTFGRGLFAFGSILALLVALNWVGLI